MKRHYKYLFLAFISLSLYARGQVTENDSLIRVDQEFEVYSKRSLGQMTDRDTFFLVPKFTSKCYQQNIKYPFHYDRGTLEGEIPIRSWVKVQASYEKHAFKINNVDTFLVVKFVGSKQDTYYTLSIHKNSDTILMNFFHIGGQKCQTLTLKKEVFEYLLVENNIVSAYPSYDTYTKITLRKKQKFADKK